MTAPVPTPLRGAPRPIRDLGALLAQRGTPLRDAEGVTVPRGDGEWHAHTPIGLVRVYRSRGFWSTDVALPGVNHYVPADAWAACPTGGRLSLMNRVPPAEAAAFVTGLLEAPRLPSYDAACLARVIEEREARRTGTGGRTRWVALAVVLAVTVVSFWGGVALDQPTLRLMAGVGTVALLGMLLDPLVRKRWGG
ncbi:MAG TPA: hypothetical protein GXZ45_10905 [Propionibacterium sp.]|nr:hypothetical protein [Propionibacterium sp.]